MIIEMKKGWVYNNNLNKNEVRCLGTTPGGNYILIFMDPRITSEGYVLNKGSTINYSLVKSCPEDELADQDF